MSLPRKTGMPARKKPMRARSPGLCAQKRQQRRAYAAADDAAQTWCSACGKTGPVEHSHLFSQKAYPEHANNPLNWLQKCRACHELFEHQKGVFAANYPQAWALILARMRQVDPRAYAYFRMRHSY